ncbi:MAG: outer membrane protein [Cyclobacteriaceae bacterium]|nr:MAG: outer membrane protein [Cyclobacteriaceae bacterium]
MKSLKYIIPLLAMVVAFGSCEQEWPVFPPPNTPIPPPSPDPSPGSADFTKFVVLGNSLTAGFQSNALFDAGQMNSLGNILAQQFSLVGGGEFVQPEINSENGFNSLFSDLSDANPANWVIKGRLILAGNPPLPSPTDSDLGAVPVPTVNPGFVYTGAPINNFSVPGVLLGQALIPQTGDWNLAGLDPRFNPFYARFASNPGTSTMIGDAVAAGGSFFTMWLGSNDVLLYAVTGASGQAPLTSASDFAFQYGAALSIITTDPDIQGVVANVPDITSLPYFKLVPWNAIPFANGDPLINLANQAYSLYNGGLAQAAGAGLITAEEAQRRTIQFAAGTNGIVVADETLTDLSGLGLPAIRQATEADLIGLTAGVVLGTLADPNNPLSIIGVAVPLEDRFTLLAHELAEVQASTDAFNAIILNTISAIGVDDRVAFADINKAYKDLVDQGPQLIDGVAVSAGLAPPTGIFSEDGVHPNSRGYAVTANVFIEAINAKFGAVIPKANIGLFPGNGLPQ